ncbi:HEAT repeat domain-containing protein [Cyanobacterium stanieri LEGE 03274]|uniref:HEAT repeat domain-containing protein n=1 Tax=Cyanobacterium stanieri LEGE 03274 TaxID=1828756 RepID=A0ABR9V4D2_9CHRO|nr:HEAT repeat domain-containing protein [Cyanobacterium stanieri]MBE9222764.1 HEAT repeat domain-containing protein [Cyanobacterium stanieri LEGE 03274]
MDTEKLTKLESKLYSEIPLLGDRLRQQAIKELSAIKTPQSIEILTKALIFSEDKNVRNGVLNTLRQIKLQDTALIDAVCQLWADNREIELTKLIKLKGWVANQPLKLRVLTAVSLGWQGILEEENKIQVAEILLDLLNDKEREIRDKAREWLTSLSDEDLQAHMCRLASEKNNQDALDIAIEVNYRPLEPSQSALFYYFTQQWERYQDIDPDYHLLEEVYYHAPDELKERIDSHGIGLKRLEWLWMLLGGKEGRRIPTIGAQRWKKILEVMTSARNWDTLWELITVVPVRWSREIVKILKNNRWLPNAPEEKQIFNEVLNFSLKIKGKSIPQGKLIRCVYDWHHGDKISAIALTPDDKVLISGGGELIKLWNTETGAPITQLKRHIKGVTTLALSNDGITLASGSRDKTVSVWRIPEGNNLTNLSANNASVWSLSMTNDSKIIASASYREIRLWQYPSGKLYKTLTGFKTEVECTLISHDDKYIIAGGGKNDHTIRIWNLPEGENKYTLTGHQGAITSLALCPANATLASASKDGTVKLWSLSTGENKATLEGHHSTIWQLGITPDGTTLVTVSEDKTIKIWQLATGMLKATLEGHQGAIWCLDISQDGKLLATGSRDNTIRLWSLPDGKPMGVLKTHQKPIRHVKIGCDRTFIITGSDDQTLKLWKWDLPQLCNLPIFNISTPQQKSISDILSNQELTPEEENWLKLTEKLLNIKNQRNQTIPSEKNLPSNTDENKINLEQSREK